MDRCESVWAGVPVDSHVLQRHRNGHLVQEIVQEMQGAGEPVGVARLRDRESLVERVELLLARAERIVGEAERASELNVALQGLKEARLCIELLARLAGELQAGFQIHIHPEWVQMRAVVVEALAPYPQARASVVEALQQMTQGPEANEGMRRAAYQRALGHPSNGHYRGRGDDAC